ncbi:competence protein [Bordetella pertussis STO1-CHOC-0017]|nr:competence protein [Bordetella pertussis STO1-CHOC-0017]
MRRWGGRWGGPSWPARPWCRGWRRWTASWESPAWRRWARWRHGGPRGGQAGHGGSAASWSCPRWPPAWAWRRPPDRRSGGWPMPSTRHATIVWRGWMRGWRSWRRAMPGRGASWRGLPDDRPAGLPARLLVTWRALPGQALPEVVPGQRWRMALRVRRPHASQNPHAADTEARLLARGVRGLASVRGRPLLLDDDPWADAGIAIERARHRVRAGMRQALAGLRYAPVLVALAIGDQAGVAREDWQVFQRSGIMHLVSISGMHVTAVAALGGWLAGWLWRRACWRGVPLAERAPAQRVAVLAALGPALAYCLLAGWSVPTRRAFFMLAAVAAAVALRWPATPSRLLTLAAVAVAVLDPWAPLAPGFWLSFGAVAVLVGTGAGARPRGMRARLRAALLGFGRTQMAVTLALTPLLAFLVRQVSLGSPLANALAIPVVSLAVTPLALLCGALSALPGGQGPAWLAGAAGHGLFALLMAPVDWIGRAEWSGLDVAAAPWPWLALALAGAAWALQAPGWPARHCGWLCMLPLLVWRPERPPPGYL